MKRMIRRQTGIDRKKWRRIRRQTGIDRERVDRKIDRKKESR